MPLVFLKTCSVDLAGLEFLELHLPLTPGTGVEGVHPTAGFIWTFLMMQVVYLKVYKVECTPN